MDERRQGKEVRGGKGRKERREREEGSRNAERGGEGGLWFHFQPEVNGRVIGKIRCDTDGKD